MQQQRRVVGGSTQLAERARMHARTQLPHACAPCMVHAQGSEEARKQQEAERNKAEAAARAAAELERAAAHDAGAGGRDADGVEPADGGAASASALAPAPAAAPAGGRALRNQFNFSDRAAQTSSYPLRDRGTATEPPPTATVSGAGGTCARLPACLLGLPIA